MVYSILTNQTKETFKTVTFPLEELFSKTSSELGEGIANKLNSTTFVRYCVYIDLDLDVDINWIVTDDGSENSGAIKTKHLTPFLSHSY